MPRNRVTTALIPAAGRGTRFLPVTKVVPKELLPIVSTPALEYVVAEAVRNGLTDVILVVNQGKQAIADYFAPHPELEAALAAKRDDAALAAIRRPEQLATIHEVEQFEPRGLGDAVAHGEDLAAGGAVAVLLPDDLIDESDDLLEQMLRVYDEHGGVVVGLMDVPRAEIGRYGCVATSRVDGDVVTIEDLVEKPAPEQAPSTLAIIGRYVLPPEIFASIRDAPPGAGGEIQLTDAMLRLVRDGVPAHGVVFRGQRYDTGEPFGYVRAVVQLATRHPELGAPFTAWLRDYVSGLEREE
jgi:UTP--glucose-1-phosphate uridylyltransferase